MNIFGMGDKTEATKEKQMAEILGPTKEQLEFDKKFGKTLETNKQKSKKLKQEHTKQALSTASLISDLEKSSTESNISESDKLTKLAEAQLLRNELSLYDTAESANEANEALMEEKHMHVRVSNPINKIKGLKSRIQDKAESTAYKAGMLTSIVNLVVKLFSSKIRGWMAKQNIEEAEAKKKSDKPKDKISGYWTTGVYRVADMLLKVFDNGGDTTDSSLEDMIGVNEPQPDVKSADELDKDLPDEEKLPNVYETIADHAKSLADEALGLKNYKREANINNLWYKLFGKKIYDKEKLGEIESFEDLIKKNIVQIDKDGLLSFTKKFKPNVNLLNKDEQDTLAQYITALYDHSLRANELTKEAMKTLNNIKDEQGKVVIEGMLQQSFKAKGLSLDLHKDDSGSVDKVDVALFPPIVENTIAKNGIPTDMSKAIEDFAVMKDAQTTIQNLNNITYENSNTINIDQGNTNITFDKSTEDIIKKSTDLNLLIGEADKSEDINISPGKETKTSETSITSSMSKEDAIRLSWNNKQSNKKKEKENEVTLELNFNSTDTVENNVNVIGQVVSVPNNSKVDDGKGDFTSLNEKTR